MMRFSSGPTTPSLEINFCLTPHSGLITLVKIISLKSQGAQMDAGLEAGVRGFWAEAAAYLSTNW